MCVPSGCGTVRDVFTTVAFTFTFRVMQTMRNRYVIYTRKKRTAHSQSDYYTLATLQEGATDEYLERGGKEILTSQIPANDGPNLR